MGTRERGSGRTVSEAGAQGLPAVALDRRRFLAGLGLVAGAGVLAACGVSGDKGGAASTTRRPYSALEGPDMSGAATGVRAQDDLFRHVNGRWYDTYQLPEDKASTGAMELMGDEVEQQLKAIVEAIRDPRPGSDEAKVRDLYRTYVDTAAIEKAGLDPIRPLLAKIDGAADRAALFDVVAQLERSDAGWNVVSLDIGADTKNSTRNIVTVSPAGTVLEKDQYTDPQYEDLRTVYRDYLRTTAQLVGVKDPAGAAQRIFDLESTLAAAQWTRKEYGDPNATYNLYQWDRLAELAPGFDWIRWRDLNGVTAEASKDLVVMHPAYLTAAAKAWAETDLETLKDRARMGVVQTYTAVLPKAFGDSLFELTKVTQGAEKQQDRWKDAIAFLNKSVGEALGKLYVEKHFSADAKDQVNKLVENIKGAYRRSFEQSPWMTQPTRAAAIAKLDKIMTKMGYPDKWEDYAALSTNSTSAAENLRAVIRYVGDRELRKLGEPVDRAAWSMVPQEVNAQYDPTLNEICFPAAILQKPFYSPDYRAAVNYGGIGAVIGHEIGHAFDDSGSQFDGDGNLRNWWAPEDRAEFDKRSNAVIAQFDPLVPFGLGPEYKVDGKLTVGENLADLGGVSVALQAFRIAVANRDPGTEFADTSGAASPSSSAAAAPDEMLVPFFLSYSRSWQSKSRPETAKQLLLVDTHAPGEYRVNQIVKNLDAFVSAFGVKPGDGEWLDPKDRVFLW